MKVLKVNIVQVNTAKAEAEMAYGLQASKVQARIKEEEMQVKYLLCRCNYDNCPGASGGEAAGDQHPAAGDQEEGEGAGLQGEKDSDEW